MKTPHAKAVHAFARNLQWLLAFRLAVAMATAWFFLWGIVVLALRVFGVQNACCLLPGFAAVVPLFALAVWRARRQRPAFAQIRANYDRLNACGGIIMSEETGDMGAWVAQLPEAAVPRLRWRSNRAMALLGVSAIFAAVALLVPERLTHFTFRRPLEIGQTVGQLNAEVQTLAQEKIIPDKKAGELQKQLGRLQDDSYGYDPDKTWEALDHIKQFNADTAKEAAEEALTKTDQLTQAETMTAAMEHAAETGMSEVTASQATRNLASLLNAARLEQGLLNGKIPPELLAGLNGLNKEQLDKLLQALASDKNALGRTMTNLANLRLIDAATLSKCRQAGQCHNPAALAEYLSTCTNGCNAARCCDLCCAGSPGGMRGGPGAPMTWSDGVSEQDLKFQEHVLPPATRLSEAQLIGASKATPQPAGEDVAAQHGALDGATGSGGAAHLQLILPEQRQAIRNFFKREN